MKKVILTIYLFLLSITTICAKTINVKFNKCVDGDTAKFIYKDETITARFLAIDTPEIKHSNIEAEPFGNEASDFTCKKLKIGNKIILEFDENSEEKDKYGRYLVWVFIDDKLLQEELVSEGLAEVKYLYGDYKYTNSLLQLEQNAKAENKGIWSKVSSDKKWYDYFDEYKEIIIIIGVLIIICIFNIKTRNEVKKVVKKKLEKEVKNKIKKQIK